MKTENVFRMVDGVVGTAALVGAVASFALLDLGPTLVPVWFVWLIAVSNLAFATVNLTRAISYDTRLMLVTYTVMTLSLGWWFGSTGFAAVLIAMFFAGGFLEGICREGLYRKHTLAQHKVTRVMNPGRRGVTVRTPSYRLRRRGVENRITFGVRRA